MEKIRNILLNLLEENYDLKIDKLNMQKYIRELEQEISDLTEEVELDEEEEETIH